MYTSLRCFPPTRSALLVLVLLAAGPAAAAGVSCHCFRDRGFNAEDPAAVDPYVLATTQNSLLAAEFGIPKKSVVRAKMTGTDGGQLWVSHFLARTSGRGVDELLELRAGAGSWGAALVGAGLELPPSLGPAHLERQTPGVDANADSALAAAVVDQVLAARLGAAPDALRELRATGATDAEVIAAIYLGLRSGKTPIALLQEVRAGKASWGSILDATGLAAEGIGEDLAKRFP